MTMPASSGRTRVAPFRRRLINLRAAMRPATRCATRSTRKLGAGIDALYDDREERAGAKFARWI